MERKLCPFALGYTVSHLIHLQGHYPSCPPLQSFPSFSFHRQQKIEEKKATWRTMFFVSLTAILPFKSRHMDLLFYRVFCLFCSRFFVVDFFFFCGGLIFWFYLFVCLFFLTFKGKSFFLELFFLLFFLFQVMHLPRSSIFWIHHLQQEFIFHIFKHGYESYILLI